MPLEARGPGLPRLNQELSSSVQATAAAVLFLGITVPHCPGSSTPTKQPECTFKSETESRLLKGLELLARDGPHFPVLLLGSPLSAPPYPSFRSPWPSRSSPWHLRTFAHAPPLPYTLGLCRWQVRP